MKHQDEPKGRRTFLKQGMAGLAGAALAPALLKAGGTQAGGPAGSKPKIVARTLGKTGLKIPVVSMGASCQDPVLYKQALDSGITHIDTSQYYFNGRHESVVGEALKGRRRDSYIVATSILLGNGAMGSYSTMKKEDAPQLAERFEPSLKRIGVDAVDIFYYASVGNRATALYEPLIESIQKLKKAGKTRFIGYAIHGGQAEVLKAMIEAKIFDVALVAYNIRDNKRDEIRAAMAEAAKAGIGIIIMKPMAGGFWDGRARKEPINAQAALKFVLQDEFVTTAIPGITSADQLTADMAIMNSLTLTPQDKIDLRMVEAGTPDAVAAAGLYCSQCGECLGQCPAGLDIPTVMRSYMYANGYGNWSQAQAAMGQIDLGRLRCGGCASCSVRCASGFDVRERALDMAALIGL